MSQGNPKATDEEPKNVHEQTETSSILRLLNNMWAKWPQRENTQPHGGYAEWYADDGDHQQEWWNEILHCDAQSSKDEPNDIS